MSYSYEYSKLPDQIFTPPTYKDLSEASTEVITLVNQIKSLQAAGNYTQAASKVADNYAILKNYWLGADQVNAMSEEIMALENYATDTKQSIFVSDTMPAAANTKGDVWIGTAAI